MKMRMVTYPHEVKSVAATVDCPEFGGRYHVILSYDAKRKIHIITASNYFVSLETTSPTNFSYKLCENDVKEGDALAIQQIVRDILLPQLWDEECDYEEYLDKTSRFDGYLGGSRLQLLDQDANTLTFKNGKFEILKHAEPIRFDFIK